MRGEPVYRIVCQRHLFVDGKQTWAVKRDGILDPISFHKSEALAKRKIEKLVRDKKLGLI